MPWDPPLIFAEDHLQIGQLFGQQAVFGQAAGQGGQLLWRYVVLFHFRDEVIGHLDEGIFAPAAGKDLQLFFFVAQNLGQQDVPAVLVDECISAAALLRQETAAQAGHADDLHIQRPRTPRSRNACFSPSRVYWSGTMTKVLLGRTFDAA